MEKKMNGMSIVAIILAFIFPVIGLILAIVAKKKDSEDKLAKTAFVISLIMVILGVIGTIGCFGCSACMMASSDTSESTPQTTTSVTENIEITTVEEAIPTETTTVPEITTTAKETTTVPETTTTVKETTIVPETTTAVKETTTVTTKVTTVTSKANATYQEELHESVRYLIETVISSSGYSKSSVTYDEEYDMYIINVQMNGVAEAVMNIKYGISGSVSDWDGVRENLKSMCNSTRGFVREAGLESHVVINVLNDKNPDNVLLSVLDGKIVYDIMED